jgi:SanA protein
LWLILVNKYIVVFASPFIYTDIQSISWTSDVWIVLWAKVYSDWRLSRAVKERADAAITLRKAGKIRAILVSWDNRTRRYDEVTAIKKYLFAQWVPSSIVFLDYAWLDTYDSMYRAQYIFWISSLIIPTQQFHLARSVYIARNKWIDATWIVVSEYELPQLQRLQIRERFARAKAFIDVLFDVLPHHLGDKIPIDWESNSV